jgi:hypothetical protein
MHFCSMSKHQQLVLAIIVILFSVAFRLLNNQYSWASFTPMLAMSLFSGFAISDKKLAYLVPLIALILSDALLQITNTQLGFYGPSQFINYTAYLIVVFMGTKLSKPNTIKILGFTLSASIVFFIISNFSTWADTTFNMYPKTLAGLQACYIAGLAFYRQQIEANILMNPVIGDLYFALLFFGAHYLVAVRKKLAIA